MLSLQLLNISSSKSLSFTQLPIPLTTTTTNLSFRKIPRTTPIRMGGGPRTYPGGVSKWQWKRMQAKKAKQLLQARLSRERQIYEMRKRAELKAAVSELERPWETVEKPPNLFSVGADEQLKVLADRFQKPGGLDLWSDKDGPELFRQDNGLPSARFFPKGVVHSVKPYGRVAELLTNGIESLELKEEEDTSLLRRKGYSEKVMRKRGSFNLGDDVESRKTNKNVGKGSKRIELETKRVEFRNNNRVVRDGKSMMTGIRNKQLSDLEQNKSGYERRTQRRENKSKDSQVLDMSLQNDGRKKLKMTITKVSGKNGNRVRKAAASGPITMSQRDIQLAKEIREARGKGVADEVDSGSGSDGVLADLSLSEGEEWSDDEPPMRTPVNMLHKSQFLHLLSSVD